MAAAPLVLRSWERRLYFALCSSTMWEMAMRLALFVAAISLSLAVYLAPVM
jgi:hypothetical protein